MFTSVSSIPVEWEWKRINRKLKSSFLIYLNSVTCTSYAYNQRYLCCPLCYYHYLCHGRLPVLVFLLLHCYNQFVLKDVPLQPDHSVIFLLCISVSSFPSVHTQEEDWERKRCVFVHYGGVCVRVYLSLNGQMVRHSLTPCHDPSLSACRTWCGPISHTSTSLVSIFFQGAMFSPSSSTPLSKTLSICLVDILLIHNVNF